MTPEELEQAMHLERAKFAKKDSDMLEDFAGRLRAYNWEVEACGRDGKLEMEKVNSMAPEIIKMLVNYLRT